MGVPDNDNVNMDSASAPPACCDVNDFMTGLAKNIWFRMGKGIVVRMDGIYMGYYTLLGVLAPITLICLYFTSTYILRTILDRTLDIDQKNTFTSHSLLVF